MKQKIIPIITIILQIISLIWYKRPQTRIGGHDAPVAFVEFVIYEVYNLIIIGIFTILFFIIKGQKELIWKIPFILFVVLIVMGIDL